ncbi:ATP-binding protein [Puniceicoccaceae bacterium K14]|nr:ATP-binding protein [Puniceicoccaceae bacterium K14]
MVKKESSLDRVLGRIDNLDTINLTNLVKKLARERSLLETVFNTALEGILVIDDDGCVEFANSAGMRLIGLKEADVGEATLWRLVPGLRDSLGAGGEEVLKNSMSSREIELTYPERRFVRLYIMPIEHEEGAGAGVDIRRYVVILSDITAEKISREEIIESEKVASVLLLAAGVAHELGNPLNSLTIHLQLIERQLKKLETSVQSDRLESSVAVCREEVDRLDGIIKNFLEAVRPQEPDFQILNFHEVLRRVLEFQKSELSNRGINVEVDVCAEPTIISGDKNLLKQVFFNVVKNAMEAMQPGGTLSIKTRADDELFYMQIADSGSGIDQENLSKVFQPYHTTKKEGSGLGLMIVQRIMRDHGGQIGIDSRQGVGTVVTLEFPKQARKFRMIES